MHVCEAQGRNDQGLDWIDMFTLRAIALDDNPTLYYTLNLYTMHTLGNINSNVHYMLRAT